MRKILFSALLSGFRRPQMIVRPLACTFVGVSLMRFSSQIMLNDSYELELNDDLKEGELREVQVGPKKEDAVLLCKVGGVVRCLSNACPHFGAPMSAGLLVGDKVKCPWHNASFSVIDGAVEDGPLFNGLQTFPVDNKDGKITVRIQKDLLNRGRQLNMVTKGDDPTHYVIVGGGVAGQSAAETLRQAGFQGKITIISNEELYPYDRTGISKAIFFVQPAGLQVRKPEFYEQYGIDVLKNTKVESVDYTKQTVKAGSETIHYDKLLLATGGRARRPQLDGINLGNVYTLRTFADAEKIRTRAKECKNIVIVGASFIGLETAASLKSQLKDVSITVIDHNKVPFQRVLGSEIGTSLQGLHEANGVKFQLGVNFKKLGGIEKVNTVYLNDGTQIEADMVILGTGIEPNNDLAKGQLKLSKDGGIETDVFLRATSNKNVYACGDIASYPYWVTGDHVRIEHHSEAIHQGYVAALNMAGRPTALVDIPFFWTRHYDKSLQYSGVGTGFDEVIIDGSPKDLKFIAYYARKGLIIASASMNTPNAQMIISEALKQNLMPSAAELKEKKVTLDEIKSRVQAKGCACKRSNQCGVQL